MSRSLLTRGLAPFTSAAHLRRSIQIMKYLVVVLFFMVLGSSAHAAPKYDYSAVHEFPSCAIRIGMVNDHPFLAEYKKYVEVIKGNKVISSFELQKDPGGFASIYVFQTDDALILLDGLGSGLSVTPDLKITKLEQEKLDSYKINAIGRFCFAEYPRKYVYLTEQELQDLQKKISNKPVQPTSLRSAADR